jgi:hypothetical protein
MGRIFLGRNEVERILGERENLNECEEEEIKGIDEEMNSPFQLLHWICEREYLKIRADRLGYSIIDIFECQVK